LLNLRYGCHYNVSVLQDNAFMGYVVLSSYFVTQLSGVQNLDFAAGVHRQENGEIRGFRCQIEI